MTEQQSTTRHS